MIFNHCFHIRLENIKFKFNKLIVCSLGESVQSTALDMSPILIGLGGTATGLGLIVVGVLMALWRRNSSTPAKSKPPQQLTVSIFSGKPEEEEGNPDLIPTTALTNHFTGKLFITIFECLFIFFFIRNE